MTPLRQRMLEDMRVRNLCEKTQQTYLQQITTYARHFHRSPDALVRDQVREYQIHLFEVRKLAPASVRIASAALRFLYQVTLKQDWALDDIPMPKVPFRLPVVLSREEVMQFLAAVQRPKLRVLLMSAYAAPEFRS